jgi:hypothetical protein
MNSDTAKKYDQNQRRRWALDKIHAFKQSLGENQNNPSPDYALNKEPGYAKMVDYLDSMVYVLRNSKNALEAQIWSKA